MIYRSDIEDGYSNNVHYSSYRDPSTKVAFNLISEIVNIVITVGQSETSFHCTTGELYFSIHKDLLQGAIQGCFERAEYRDHQLAGGNYPLHCLPPLLLRKK